MWNLWFYNFITESSNIQDYVCIWCKIFKNKLYLLYITTKHARQHTHLNWGLLFVLFFHLSQYNELQCMFLCINMNGDFRKVFTGNSQNIVIKVWARVYRSIESKKGSLEIHLKMALGLFDPGKLVPYMKKNSKTFLTQILAYIFESFGAPALNHPMEVIFHCLSHPISLSQRENAFSSIQFKISSMGGSKARGQKIYSSS